MRALRLDYYHGRETFRAGSLVLAMGALLAAVAGVEYSASREELAAWEAKVAALHRSAESGAASAPLNPRETDAAAQEVKTAYGVYRRLALPWDTLFNTLESVSAGGVALLAIEPDAGKSTIKLTAEAKSDTDMLNYVQQLQSVDAFANVTLASHQTKQGDPTRALRFVVVAAWKMQP